MNLCQKCVLKVKPGETLCPECQSYKPTHIDWGKKEEELKQLVEKFRGKGKKYDAMVTLTGGKDSSFVLYYLTKVLKLRVLAFTWDNLLIREGSMRNIENAVKATKVDHIMFKWNTEKMKRLNKATFKEYATICFCPVYMAMGSYPAAIKNDIPLIFAGFSQGQRELDHLWTLPDQAEQKRQVKNFQKVWYEGFSGALQHQDAAAHDDVMKEIFADFTSTCIDSNPAFYPIFAPLSNYVNWSSMNDLEKTLITHLNWAKPTKTYMHTSCMIEPVRGYLEHKRGLNEMTSEMSNMIRQGSVTREESLEEMRLTGMDGKRPDLKIHNDFIGISDGEFDEILTRNLKPNPTIIKYFKEINDSLCWIKSIKTVKATVV